VQTITANAGQDQSICAGESTTLTATGGTSYSWSSNQFTQTISVTPATTTTYTVTVSDGVCSATDAVTVVVNPVPIAGVSPNQTICQGNSTTLTATGGSIYNWSHGLPNTPTVTVTPVTNTTYTVTVSNGYCTASAQVTVTVSPSTMVSAGPDFAVCATGAVNINGSAANHNTVSWTSLGTGNFVNANIINPVYMVSSGDSIAGVVALVVTANGDCGIARDTMLLTVLPPPYVNAGNDTVLCGVVPFITTNAYANYYDSLVWQSFDGGWFEDPHALHTVFHTDSTMLDSTHIELLLIIYSQCGIDSHLVSITVVPAANITAMDDVEIEIGTSIQLVATGGIDYWWYPEVFLDCKDCPSPYAKPDTITHYVVVGITEHGCIGIDTVTVEIIYVDNIFVPNAFSPNDDGFNDILFVRGHGIKKLHMIIYNRWGEKIFESHHQKYGWDGTYKGQMLNTGVFGYYLYVELYDGTMITKKGNVTLIR